MKIVPLMFIVLIILFTSFPAPTKVAGAGAIAVVRKGPSTTKLPMPEACRQEVRHCINTHVYGNAGEPEQGGSCCEKFKNSKSCVCKFLVSKDPKLSKAANGVVRGCHFRKPSCLKVPMPQECREEVKHCVNTHMYGSAGTPEHGGACCVKFKKSKSCVCKFLTSNDPKLTEAANGVVRGCNFLKPACSKI